jgi:4-hydroxy-tetrahydrodipicolinate reductase
MSTAPTEAGNPRVRVAIAGAGGRMGQALIEATLDDFQFALAAALDVPGSDAIGSDAGARVGRHTGVEVQSDVAAALRHADVLIDFTRAAGTLAHIDACVEAGIGMVIGTTGFDDAGKAMIADAARTVPIVFAANMSVGVNVLAKLVRDAAALLGPAFDIEIVEMHHRHKVDAPSGTALMLGEAAAEGAHVALRDHAVYAREGVTGPRPAGAIGFATLRGGDVVGEHTVVFAGSGERLELSHRATSRRNFAAGALRAAAYVAQRRRNGAPGLFDMTDVLDIRDAQRSGNG